LLGWITKGWSSDTDNVLETVWFSNTTCPDEVVSEVESNGEFGLKRG